MWTVLSHEFGCIYRTYSIYIVTGETRCALVQGGRKCAPSNLLEPHHRRDNKECRVFSHGFRVFDSTEPSLTTSSQKKQDGQGARTLVQGGSSASNLLEPHHRRDTKVCRARCVAFINLFEPSRTTSLESW